MASIVKIGQRWRALIRRRGHKPISKTFATKAAAANWARDIEARIEDGQPVLYAQDTLAAVIERYRKLRAHARPILDTSNEHYILKRLTEGLGKLRVTSLNSDALVSWCRQRAEEGAGPYTINMDISKLGTVLRYAGEGLPDVVGQARPKLTYLGLIGGGGKRERRPTEDELDRLCAELPQYADLIRFTVATAMRRGEVVKLTWDDVDEAKRMVLIRDRKHPRQKKGNDQWVPLLGMAWDIVQRQGRENTRIFPVHPQTLSKAFKAACDRLSIPDLHFHDLRHEGTSQLFEAGYAIQQVALVTGHASWNQLRRYAQLRPEDLHEKPKK